MWGGGAASVINQRDSHPLASLSLSLRLPLLRDVRSDVLCIEKSRHSSRSRTTAPVGILLESRRGGRTGGQASQPGARRGAASRHRCHLETRLLLCSQPCRLLLRDLSQGAARAVPGSGGRRGSWRGAEGAAVASSHVRVSFRLPHHLGIISDGENPGSEAGWR